MNHKEISKMSLFIAIIVILAATPLGYIPLGFMRATTIHIPVILGAMLMGKKNGAILGFVFAMTSFISNTINPTITSFVFTPFYNLGEFSGGFASILICFVPRILIGYVSGLLFSKIKTNKINVACIAFTSSMINTILVMSGIYIFFADSYALAKNVPTSEIFIVIFAVIVINGVIEAITASLISLGFYYSKILNIYKK